MKMVILCLATCLLSSCASGGRHVNCESKLSRINATDVSGGLVRSTAPADEPTSIPGIATPPAATP
jgi:hypothetical protein